MKRAVIWSCPPWPRRLTGGSTGFFSCWGPVHALSIKSLYECGSLHRGADTEPQSPVRQPCPLSGICPRDFTGPEQSCSFSAAQVGIRRASGPWLIPSPERPGERRNGFPGGAPIRVVRQRPCHPEGTKRPPHSRIQRSIHRTFLMKVGRNFERSNIRSSQFADGLFTNREIAATYELWASWHAGCASKMKAERKVQTDGSGSHSKITAE